MQFFLEWLAVSSRVWRTNVIYISMKTFSTYKLKCILRPPSSSVYPLHEEGLKEKLLSIFFFEVLWWSNRAPSRRVNKKKKLCKEHLSIWYACVLWWCLSISLSVCSLFDQFLYSSDFSFFPTLNIQLVEKPGVYLVTFAFPSSSAYFSGTFVLPTLYSVVDKKRFWRTTKDQHLLLEFFTRYDS